MGMRKILIFVMIGLAILIGQSHNASLTIYKDGMALIDQPVNWPITEGFNTVAFSGFPKLLYKESPFLTLKKGTVYSQRLDEDVFSTGKYYAEKQGHPITVKIHDEKLVEGTLLHFSGQSIVVQTRAGVRTFLEENIDYFEFEDQLDDLRFYPELVWNIYVTGESNARGNLIYTTGGLDWNAVYRLIIRDENHEAELIPQAIVKNTGDLDFTSSQMKLVEGNLQRSGGSKPLPQMRTMSMQPESDGLNQAAQHEGLGDFHIYTIDGKHRLKPNQTVLLKLYEPRNITFDKTYIFENSERQKREEPLKINFAFSNAKENNLGIPLPQGTVEMYQKSDDGSFVYAGSDNLKQVPRGETASLNAGHAFDVIGKHKVLNYDRQRKAEEGTIEIEIFNGREDTVQVKAIEHISGDWVIRNETSMYIKDDASTIHFPLVLNPQERKTISYTYRKEFK